MEISKADSRWDSLKNRFEILKFKGQGSFGTVAAARDRGTGQKVAIKMVSLDTEDYYPLKKLLREITIMRQLSQMDGSSLITRLLEVVVPEGVPLEKAGPLFLVIELRECDLGRMMKNSRKERRGGVGGASVVGSV